MLLLRHFDLLLLQSGHVEMSFPKLLLHGVPLCLHPLVILVLLDLVFDLTFWIAAQTWEAVLFLAPWGQISPLRLMMGGSRGSRGVDDGLGLGLRWGLLPIPVADFSELRQVLLQLNVRILLWLEDLPILGYIHSKLLQNLSYPVMFCEGQYSLGLLHRHVVHDSLIRGHFPLLMGCLKEG